MRKGAKVGPLRLVGRLEDLPFSDLEFVRQGKDDVLRLPQLGRSINPSSIERFFPSLSAVGTTYGEDLCP